VIRPALLALAAGVLLSITALPAAAQARATGLVRDLEGKPIKGATVRALNPDASPREFSAVSDDRGRWAIIGMRAGTWRFVVEAPGFATAETSTQLRVAAGPPLVFTLARELAPIPDALEPNVQQQIAAADALREKGQLDQAIAAYEGIRARNSKLNAINLVIGSAYRDRAAREQDPAARRSFLDRAIEAYNAVLKADATNERARAGLDLTRAELAALK
jgi:tetratricopeptide (TPR) repeat protein